MRDLQFGDTLPWKYEGTPYEKESELEGLATECIRCPDPTSSGVIMKITRRKLDESKEIGWSSDKFR